MTKQEALLKKDLITELLNLIEDYHLMACELTSELEKAEQEKRKLLKLIENFQNTEKDLQLLQKELEKLRATIVNLKSENQNLKELLK